MEMQFSIPQKRPFTNVFQFKITLDCGSTPGYYKRIETFKDQENKELLEWMGN